MARRGKAATRQARQKRAQARPAPQAVVPPAPAEPREDEVSASAVRVDRPSPTAPARRDRSSMVSGSSALTAHAQGQYHYVGRDLRNIGILAAIMLAIVIAAFIVFNALGIGPG